MDILGTPAGRLRPGDSNPGTVTMKPGGVGGNIARALRRLDWQVRLAAPLGEDPNGDTIARALARDGIDTSLCPRIPGRRSGIYLLIEDEHGDLVTAVSDMAIMEQMTPGQLETRAEEMMRADWVVLDANLPEETLLWASDRAAVRFAADPVSAVKAPRLRGLLPRLELIKPNVREAEALTGLTLERAGEAGLARAIADLGTRRVFLTLGAGGAYCLGQDGEGHMDCFPGPVVDTNGCGDAFFAAALTAVSRGMNTAEAGRYALAAAALKAAGRCIDERRIGAAVSAGGVENDE